MSAGTVSAQEGENASNPLAAVSNTDLRWQYLDLPDGGGRVNDYFVDGAFMASPKLKVKYELHYWETNVTGKARTGLESALAKLIYFPKQGITSGGTRYRLAVGLDYIHDFDNQDKGIGFGADQIGPFVGTALALDGGLTVIPLLQHFESVSGNDISITAARVIAIQRLPKAFWLKLDLKVPYDWEAGTIPADAEVQLGTNVREGLALYVDLKAGVGSDRLYDWGVGIGVRFNY